MSDVRSPLSVVPIERQLVAALSLDGRAFARAAEFVKADDFENPSCRAVWEALATFPDFHATGNVDIVRLATWLEAQRRNACDELAGWSTWLAAACAEVVSAAHVAHNAQTVARAALARRLMSDLGSLRSDLEALSPTDHDEQERLLSDGLDRIAKLVDAARRSGAFVTLAQCADSVLNAPDLGDGIPTGLADLDDVIRGLHRRDMVTIGACTSKGKSTLALQLALNAAQAGARTLMFPLEMAPEAVTRRALCNIAGLELFNLKRDLNDEEHGSLRSAAGVLASLPFLIADGYDATSQSIRAFARRAKDTSGIDLVVVDYLQLVSDPSVRGNSRAAEVGAVSRTLKKLALELDCTVLAVAQLNREAAKDGEPKLHHLLESGGIERDSNVVLLLSANDDEPGVLTCNVAKNTHGELRRLDLQWTKAHYRVRDLRRWREEPIYS